MEGNLTNKIENFLAAKTLHIIAKSMLFHKNHFQGRFVIRTKQKVT